MPRLPVFCSRIPPRCGKPRPSVLFSEEKLKYARNCERRVFSVTLEMNAGKMMEMEKFIMSQEDI